MATHDQAFFTPDGDVLVPTPIARGPWGSTISGTFVGGLLGRSIERDAGDPDLQPARLTVDLCRPAKLAEPVRVDTTVEHESRRLRLVDAVMTQADTVVARASAVFLRRAEQPDDPVWTWPINMPPPPTAQADLSGDVTVEVWAYGKNAAATGPSMDLTEWQHAGPKYAWVRDVVPLVEGETVTPFTRAAMAGDVTSSLTHFGTTGLNFINADYTLNLSRLPDGEYIGLASLTHYSHAGVAAGVATGLANPGFRPPRRR
jgi:Thioesterase-like superfamily